MSADRARPAAQGLKLFFDGGCRPNPGRMETAIVARGILYHQPDLGQGTSNDAEWLALLQALEVALSLGETDIELLGDSLPVINQARGRAKCRSPEARAHFTRFTELAPRFARLRIRHIGRSQNLAGIALARKRAGL
jgi:ribonuclease HI